MLYTFSHHPKLWIYAFVNFMLIEYFLSSLTDVFTDNQPDFPTIHPLFNFKGNIKKRYVVTQTSTFLWPSFILYLLVCHSCAVAPVQGEEK